MSGIQVTTKIHFIAALLAHAIADVDFNSHKGVWITSDKLASALNMHYCIHSSLRVLIGQEIGEQLLDGMPSFVLIICF